MFNMFQSQNNFIFFIRM